MLSTARAIATPRPLSAGRLNAVGADESRAFTEVFSAVPGQQPAIGIKDMFAVERRSVGVGTRAYKSEPATADAAVVTRLRAAGVGIAGMLNMHALAYGATGLSSEIGPTVNAIDSSVMPGGSSSGSGAAVAGGYVDYALGTDTGGSVRIPAALNGVVGFKPTFDRVSCDGVVPLSETLDHVGALARTVSDLAAIFSVIDPDSTTGQGMSLVGTDTIIVGLPSHFFLDELDALTRTGFSKVVETLQADGRYQIVEVDLPGAELASAAHLSVLATEALRTNLEILRSHGDELPEDVRLRLELGSLVTADDYQHGLEFQRRWKASVEGSFASCHILLTPTLAAIAPSITNQPVRLSSGDFLPQAALTRMTAPFNLSHHPAVTIPFSVLGSAVPMGVQLVGPLNSDPELVGIAETVENILAGTPAY